MTTSEVSDDPFDRLRRDPLPNAGIRIILLSQSQEPSAAGVVAPLVELVAAHGRPVESRAVQVSDGGYARALERGLLGATLPLVLVTTAEELWTNDHLTPLLAAIDACDHAIGCRLGFGRGNWARLPALFARRLIFGAPGHDIHSPCRLHRLEKLAAIPLQSSSSFLDTEIIAKATFFNHVIDEVPVPPLRGRINSKGWLADAHRVLKHPEFVRASCPAEEAQSQNEGEDGPRGEDGQGRANVEEARPLENHLAQSADELREGQGLNEGLGGIGKSIGGEEDARKEPHRQHDEIHESADGLGRFGAAGDQEADSSKRERPQHVDADHKRQAAADRHLEHERTEQQQHGEVRDYEGQPGAQESEQEIAPGHGRGDEPLEQFGDPKVDEQKADAPQTAAHRVEPD
jgi:hypothetical protein